MNKAILLSAALLLTGCGGGGSDSGTKADTPEFQATSLELDINSELMIADGESKLTLFSTAYDAAGNKKLNYRDVKYYVNGELLVNNTFTTTEEGEYNFHASINGIETQTQSVYAREVKVYDTVEIPVIFHVGEYDGYDYSHVDEAYVQKLIDMLNRGFSNSYSNNNTNAVDTGIRFRLATYAQDGSVLTEKGINRFNSQPYDDGRADYEHSFNIANDGKFGTFEIYRMSNDIHWPQDQYKNVYLVPSEDSNWAVSYVLKESSSFELDQIHQGRNYFEEGSLVTDILVQNPYDEPSQIIVHEMGHSFALLHPESYDGCVTTDSVEDTTSIDYMDFDHICEHDSKGQLFTTNPDKFHLDNFMHGYNEWGTDVTYQSDYDNFTYGQRERMRILISEGKYISDLINSTK